MITPPRKMTLQELRAGMQVFVNIDEVEVALRDEVEQLVGKILLTRTRNGGRHRVDMLADYLDAGSVRNIEERLKIIVGLSQGSLETLKRVYEAMLPGVAWGRLARDESIRRRVAEFLISPHAEETPIPQFIRESFYLPNNWPGMLQDRDYLRAIVRGNKRSQYSVSMGNGLEEAVGDAVGAAGYTFVKDKIDMVDNKEVDLVIPDTQQPQALIMASYQLTTASMQSSKANEQARMYADVQRHNRSRAQLNSPDVLFINVVDGGGWLARPRDLQSMWAHCDYIFPLSRLDGLREVLTHFISE